MNQARTGELKTDYKNAVIRLGEALQEDLAKGSIVIDGTIQRLPTGKLQPTELKASEGFLIETAGGGGFWNPLERSVERVLADVRSGYVSLAAARREYSVVINQQGRRFELDVEATAALRQGRR